MRIGIPDDYGDIVRTLPSFAKIADRPVSIWTDAMHEPAALAARLAGIEALVLVRERTPVTAALLERLPDLRMISISGPYPNVDAAACTTRGILLCQAKNRETFATPELTWALVLAAMRKIPEEAARMRAGRWQRGDGRVLHKKTLGVMGFGRIGSVVARYGKAFGMRVIVCTGERSATAAQAEGFTLCGKDELFSQADVLCVHVRYGAKTSGIIGREDLARMKPDALFVNTSRAELIEPGALAEALRNGRPGFAAVDVYETEPVTDPADPLLTMPNVLCTPHLGFVAREPFDDYFSDQFDRVLAFERGQPIDVVNPQALAAAR